MCWLLCSLVDHHHIHLKTPTFGYLDMKSLNRNLTKFSNHYPTALSWYLVIAPLDYPCLDPLLNQCPLFMRAREWWLPKNPTYVVLWHILRITALLCLRSTTLFTMINRIHHSGLMALLPESIQTDAACVGMHSKDPPMWYCVTYADT